jgi:MFS family permease
MKRENLLAALAACLTLLLLAVCGTKGATQNLWWVAILMIFLGPIALAGYVIAFYLVSHFSQKLKMDGFLFYIFASTILGALVFALPTGFGFLTAFSRGHFNPKLVHWGMERALMFVGAIGGAIGGITLYVAKPIPASHSTPPAYN